MYTTFMHRALFFLRIVLGWLFLYAGYTKIIDPSWSAAGYLSNASTFPQFFAWLAQPEYIQWVNLINEWGLFIVGALLIIGLFTRVAALAGIVLMVLYYLPILQFPYVEHGYLVDDHIIYITAFLVLFAARAGEYIGLDAMRK